MLTIYQSITLLKVSVVVSQVNCDGATLFFALVVFLDIVVGNVTLDWGR